jgi:hypothetical protein
MRGELLRELTGLRQAMACFAVRFAPVWCNTIQIRKGRVIRRTPDMELVVMSLRAREYRHARRLITQTKDHRKWYVDGLRILESHGLPTDGYPTFAEISAEQHYPEDDMHMVTLVDLPSKRSIGWPAKDDESPV